MMMILEKHLYAFRKTFRKLSREHHFLKCPVPPNAVIIFGMCFSKVSQKRFIHKQNGKSFDHEGQPLTLKGQSLRCFPTNKNFPQIMYVFHKINVLGFMFQTLWVGRLDYIQCHNRRFCFWYPTECRLCPVYPKCTLSTQTR